MNKHVAAAMTARGIFTAARYFAAVYAEHYIFKIAF
jgi:hypothetical protein